jgi:hypothetical protein
MCRELELLSIALAVVRAVSGRTDAELIQGFVSESE